jgi:hypothetical protein
MPLLPMSVASSGHESGIASLPPVASEALAIPPMAHPAGVGPPTPLHLGAPADEHAADPRFGANTRARPLAEMRDGLEALSALPTARSGHDSVASPQPSGPVPPAATQNAHNPHRDASSVGTTAINEELLRSLRSEQEQLGQLIQHPF